MVILRGFSFKHKTAFWRKKHLLEFGKTNATHDIFHITDNKYYIAVQYNKITVYLTCVDSTKNENVFIYASVMHCRVYFYLFNSF